MTDPTTHHPATDTVAEIVALALGEDRAAFDVTTRATVAPDQPGEATLLYKESGVVCGLVVFAEAFAQLSPEVEVEPLVDEGEWVKAGTVAAEIRGPLAAILSAERVALNLLQRMSGIATQAQQYVDAAADGGHARVVDTRKTTPGLRALERYAVRVGGAHNHRNTLEDGVLVKDNHLAAAASRGTPMRDLIAQVRASVPHTLKIEVEVTSPEMAREAVEAGAEVVLLDNMSPDVMRQVVAEIKASHPSVLLEASGGVRLETIREVAATGVDLISCGALTHSAPALDISLDVRPA